MYFCALTASSPEQTIAEVLSIGEQFKTNAHNLVQTVFNNRGNILWNLLSILFIFLAARFLLSVISSFTKSIMSREKFNTSTSQGKRMHTLLTLFRSVSRYCIYIVAFFLSLGCLGLGKTVNALLVTAGIGSFAIGFGAQNLIRDVITGLFMIFENQFSVGDYIKLDEAEGTVEATAMRVTYLRTFKGEQVIIPNGTISRVINYTRGNSVAALTISTCYESNTRFVLELIQQAISQYTENHPELIEEPPFVQGITSFGQSSVDIGIICKVKPMKQWEVERGMRLAIKEIFDLNEIEFPYPHVVTVPYSPKKEDISYGDIFTKDSTETEEELSDWKNADTSED